MHGRRIEDNILHFHASIPEKRPKLNAENMKNGVGYYLQNYRKRGYNVEGTIQVDTTYIVILVPVLYCITSTLKRGAKGGKCIRNLL